MATFEYDGREVTVLTLHELELGDLAFIQREWDISGVIEMESGLNSLDPVAFRALLVTSIRRTDPNVSPTTGAIDRVAVLPLAEKMADERAERLEREAEEAKKKARPTRGRSSTRGRSGSPVSA